MNLKNLLYILVLLTVTTLSYAQEDAAAVFLLQEQQNSRRADDRKRGTEATMVANQAIVIAQLVAKSPIQLAPSEKENPNNINGPSWEPTLNAFINFRTADKTIQVRKILNTLETLRAINKEAPKRNQVEELLALMKETTRTKNLLTPEEVEITRSLNIQWIDDLHQFLSLNFPLPANASNITFQP